MKAIALIVCLIVSVIADPQAGTKSAKLQFSSSDAQVYSGSDLERKTLLTATDISDRYRPVSSVYEETGTRYVKRPVSYYNSGAVSSVLPSSYTSGQVGYLNGQPVEWLSNRWYYANGGSAVPLHLISAITVPSSYAGSYSGSYGSSVYPSTYSSRRLAYISGRPVHYQNDQWYYVNDGSVVPSHLWSSLTLPSTYANYATGKIAYLNGQAVQWLNDRWYYVNSNSPVPYSLVPSIAGIQPSTYTSGKIAYVNGEPVQWTNNQWYYVNGGAVVPAGARIEYDSLWNSRGVVGGVLGGVVPSSWNQIAYTSPLYNAQRDVYTVTSRPYGTIGSGARPGAYSGYDNRWYTKTNVQKVVPFYARPEYAQGSYAAGSNKALTSSFKQETESEVEKDWK